jgi:NADH-quinone oxidoreductase subunit G
LLASPRKGVLLLGLEPDADCWDPAQAQASLARSDLVVALTAYRSSSLEACADIMLPIAGFAETSGTYVNADGRWQSFRGAVAPPGAARPAWKVLRVLGNLLDLEGFDYVSSEQVCEELQALCAELQPDNTLGGAVTDQPTAAPGLTRIGEVPLYALDPLVRRAEALQQTADAVQAGIRINPATAAALGLDGAERAVAVQGEARAELPLQIDAGVPDDCVRIPAGVPGTGMLGGQFAAVMLEKG